MLDSKVCWFISGMHYCVSGIIPECNSLLTIRKNRAFAISESSFAGGEKREK